MQERSDIPSIVQLLVLANFYMDGREVKEPTYRFQFLVRDFNLEDFGEKDFDIRYFDI